jgi:iron uptake system component EfeO
VTLDAGTYTLYCPGGDNGALGSTVPTAAERGTLTVTGKASTAQSAEAQAAVENYRRYIEEQTALLVSDTAPFVKAVQDGNVSESKALYPAARLPYERVEPVAESFGGLDPKIDARAGDVPAAKWTGFHPIEKGLWVDDTTQGMDPLAAKLLDDVKLLQRKVTTIKLEPAQIANGANELLTEVSSSKITGEEERYSHTDLWDFKANVEGSKAAFDAVKPILEQRDPKLASEIEQRFGDVDKALTPYKRGDGYVLYGDLTEQDKRTLAQSIDALAEPLSHVASIVVQQ